MSSSRVGLSFTIATFHKNTAQIIMIHRQSIILTLAMTNQANHDLKNNRKNWMNYGKHYTLAIHWIQLMTSVLWETSITAPYSTSHQSSLPRLTNQAKETSLVLFVKEGLVQPNLGSSAAATRSADNCVQLIRATNHLQPWWGFSNAMVGCQTVKPCALSDGWRVMILAAGRIFLPHVSSG